LPVSILIGQSTKPIQALSIWWRHRSPRVSQPRGPCWKIARRWRIEDLTARVLTTGRTGWYLRVLIEGHVEAGMPIVLLDRPYPEWTIARVNEIIHHRGHPDTAALAACPLLNAGLRARLAKRAKTDA